MNNPQQYADLPLETIEAALSHIDPNCERDAWARIGMALKSELGEAGFEVWDAWSRNADSYNVRDARDTWRSIRSGGGVGIATLIYIAKEAGYRPEAKPRTLDPQAALERRQRREEEQRREAEEQARRQERAAQQAAQIWEAAQPLAEPDHPYLQRKAIRIPGPVRVGKYWRYVAEAQAEIEVDGALLIPIRSPERQITSVQAIFPDDANALGRDRDYLPGGRKQGCYFNIGMPTGEVGETILIGEGYATCASAHEATGAMAIVSFDAGNLLPVAQSIRQRLPHARLVLLADNDRFGKKNVGILAAAEAARAVGAFVAVPQFASDEFQPTDFNDLAQREGLEVVAQQIAQAQAPQDEAPANDNQPQARPPAALDPSDIATVDWYSPFPDFNGKGKPLGTIENVAEACRRLGVTIRYNVIKKEDEILIPGKSFSVDNAANASLAWLSSACTRFGVPTGPLGDYVIYLADQNLYNPVVNWITSKPWDGESRLQDLFDTIDAVDNELKCILMKRWMISAVAAAFRHDGVSAHGVLTLQGDQYLGKTKWFKTLVPEGMGLLKDGMLLQPHDKDSVKQVCSFWLVELGELDATFRKSDIAALKSFITNQSDVLRRAYAKKESHFARRTVFFASVNPKQFLHDATGNRRYWTIEARWIDHSHQLNMQQIWAEVWELWKAGESYYLQPEEMQRLNSANEEFTVLDPVHERIESKLDWAAPVIEWAWRSATDVLQEIGFDRPTVGDVNKAAAFLRSKNGNQGKRTHSGRVILAPPKINTGGWR